MHWYFRLLCADIAYTEIPACCAWHESDSGKWILAIADVHCDGADSIGVGKSSYPRFLGYDIPSDRHEYVWRVHVALGGVGVAEQAAIFTMVPVHGKLEFHRGDSVEYSVVWLRICCMSCGFRAASEDSLYWTFVCSIDIMNWLVK